MEHVHRETLRKARVQLVSDLRNIEEILDHLFAENILSTSQQQLILAETTPAQRSRHLLDQIVRCGPKAFASFCSALKITGQHHLLELLQTSETKKSEKVEHGISRSVENPVGIMQPDEPTDIKLETDADYYAHIPPYSVTSSPRGYILLINIANFHPTSGLKSRVGSEKDLLSLSSLFTDYAYAVEVLKDPDHIILFSRLSEFSSKCEHKLVDAGGLVIMSHGLRDHIYTSDGYLVALEKILSFFTNKSLAGLAGKPKLIIIQACRGDAKDRGIFVADSSAETLNQPSRPDVIDAPINVQSAINSLPHMSDCVIAYSTLPGFVSWRSEDTGSWFIQVFVDVFHRLGSRLHVMDLLAEVNRLIVEQSQIQTFKQISQPATTLCRPFFLSTKREK